MVEPSAPELPPELEITFQGRTLRVKMPTAEQLLVWKRTLRKLQDAEVKSWNADQALAALERTRRIIDSVLVNHDDADWLDDEMLAGNLTLLDTASIINMTVAVFADAAEAETNRETRRAAKKTTAPVKKTTPVKKATRKAPPR